MTLCTRATIPLYYAIAGLQAVTQLTQLRALHLSRNRLKLLPEAVGSLKALQWLDLRRNAPPACSKCAAQPRSLESQLQEAKAVNLGRARLDNATAHCLCLLRLALHHALHAPGLCSL